MKFFDYWKALNARFDEGDLPAMTQLVGYKLLAIFNERMFPSSLAISDRELMERTGIPSGHTIVDARRRLKNAGLIDCDTRQGKTTRYRLTMQHRGSSEGAVGEQLGSSEGAVGEQLGSSEGAVKSSSYIRAREDVDVDIDYKEGGAGEEDLFKIWARECHRPLGATSKYELAAFEEQFGFEQCKAAIVKVSQTRAYPSFDDFKKLLTGEQSGSKYKSRARGGEKVVQFDSYPTDPRGVDTSWIYADD